MISAVLIGVKRGNDWAMRRYFFLGILIVGVLSGLVYYVWLVVSALYEDWSLGKDVKKIRAETERRRQQRAEENARRLDNGCDHLFGETLGGFPPFACRRCGLERQRPKGPCDHVWRLSKDSIPGAYCEKCGKKYVSPTVAGTPHKTT